MTAPADDAEVLDKAQERLVSKRAARGIATLTIARPGAEETPEREPEANPTQKERPGDVILREIERDIERRASSRAPNARAIPATLKPATPSTPDDEIDLDDPYAPPIPEGDYLAIYITTERGRVQGRGVLFVHFRITAGDHAGRRLIRFYNEKRGSRLARTSSLWRDYVRLTHRRPPSAGFKPSWLVSGCEVLVRVVTVHEHVENGVRVPMEACERYSKIDLLLSITAGSPPALSGSRDGKVPQKKRTSSSSPNGTAT
jgi:hypothetical protein